MTEEGIKCAFTPTSKGLNKHTVDKSTCGNIFGGERLETNANGVDGTCYATLGIDIDQNGETYMITGVEKKLITRFIMLPMK